MHKQERDGNASFSRFYMESQVAKNTSNCQSFSVSLLGNSAAIKELLQQQLVAAMSLSGIGMATADAPGCAELTPEMVPLQRLSDDSCVLYRSAIALKLAPLWQQSPLDIANQLVTSFATISQYTTGQICLEFSVEVVFPGWINFRLSDQGLAAWLQHLVHTKLRLIVAHGEGREDGEVNSPLSSSSPSSPSSPSSLFPVQYAHARCCSLLRLAHRQGLIKLKDLDFKTLDWQLLEPNPIPWLNDDQAALRLVDPAEKRLIAQILDSPDALSDPGQLSQRKLASALSNEFERFYSNCRIWGEVKIETPKLAQARLGLVAVTQALLRSLLQDHLGVTAPAEL
ncbi:MAG: hypothetical protein ICV55_11395 [Coleofasciculus sp. C3-bin4]|nr:hypothetical protein [Coleofasciculus sp. C3-bin4]